MFKIDKVTKITEDRKRVGRGGKRGTHSGRGKEGQKSRTGSSSEIKPFFEGGQMPLVRRLPRRGFVNRFRKERCIIGMHLLEEKFQNGDVVNRESLCEKGLLKNSDDREIKILDSGTLTKKLTVEVDAVSASAGETIQKAGGSLHLK